MASGREVIEKIDEVIGNTLERTALHEKIYFGSDIKEQWDFLLTKSDRTAHNFFVGIPKLGDTILFYQLRAVDYSFFTTRSEIISYPPKLANELKKAVISGIAIIDSKKDGSGGEGTIISGGVGCNFVDIKLASRWFKGYAFTVIITGKYIEEETNVKSGKLNVLNNLI
jgi:hypothetical protein